MLVVCMAATAGYWREAETVSALHAALPYFIAGTVVALVLPGLTGWWSRRRPVYVLTYRLGRSSSADSAGLSPDWWIKDGRPSRVNVDNFVKGLARAHRDWHDDFRSEAEVFDKLTSLHEKSILTDDEMNDVRSRLLNRASCHHCMRLSRSVAPPSVRFVAIPSHTSRVEPSVGCLR